MSPARMSPSICRPGSSCVLLLLLLLLMNPSPSWAHEPPQYAAGPDLLPESITWATNPEGSPIVPGGSWSGTYTVRPIWTYRYEHVDSFFLDGPTLWTLSSITNAPPNNVGNSLLVSQAFQNPTTGGNTSNRAHVYWGFDDPASSPAVYVNAPALTPPVRSYLDSWPDDAAVYTASATGGSVLSFGLTFNIPASWESYLCPGALVPHAYIGLSGIASDPNFLQATLYSAWGYNGGEDARHRVLLPCRQPAIELTMTDTIRNTTGRAGESGTMTVGYCMTATNTSADVHLARYTVTDESIGYGETREIALGPGEADTVCAPDYTHSVVWPVSGSLCVTNASGAAVLAETPEGWGERSAGSPQDGFTRRVFSASATAGAGLQTCVTPAAVTLATFTATNTAEGVKVLWETVSERDNVGFHLYRSEAQGAEPPTAYDPAWKRLNPLLIPCSTPGSAEGHIYAWMDNSAVSYKGYWYMLEDLDLRGASTRHQAIERSISLPNTLRLSRLSATGKRWPAEGVVLALALGGAIWQRRRCR
jgi:hypothetical protein